MHTLRAKDKENALNEIRILGSHLILMNIILAMGHTHPLILVYKATPCYWLEMVVLNWQFHIKHIQETICHFFNHILKNFNIFSQNFF